jgi:TRAP-type mannitol/chloroaromatic compound transport system substrate-binding protein
MKLTFRISSVLIAAALLASPAMAADEKVRWKLAMTWSSTLTPFATAPLNLAKMVEEMSGGNFTIRVEGAEKHKAALGILDMTKGGQYEMGHSAS